MREESVPSARRWCAGLVPGALVLGLAAAAGAHPFHGGHSGLTGSLLHPMGGIDHWLSLLALGALAAALGAHAGVRLAVAFLAGMLAGGVLARAGIPLPRLDAAVAASVVALGTWIAASGGASLAGALLLGGFGALHGAAHAASGGFASLPAAAGLLLGTALLQAAGAGLGIGLLRAAGRPALRAAGAAVAAVGVVLLST